MPAIRPAAHQFVVLAVALALVGGLFVLPKGILKPKEGKAELTKDAARTANRDGGGPNTNGSKVDASSGPTSPEAATVGVEGAAAGTPGAAPHTTATKEQRQQLNGWLGQLGKVKEEKPKAELLRQLARGYEVVQRFDSAGYYYEQLAALQPGVQATQRAADAYFQAFSFATSDERIKLMGGKARELYAQVLKQQPDNLDAKTNLGMAYMESENPVQGITLLREVLAADPRNEKALYNMGILAVKSSQFDKAVLRFQELVKINPKNVNAQFYLGVTAARTGANALARTAFKAAKSLSADPALAASVDEELAKLK